MTSDDLRPGQMPGDSSGPDDDALRRAAARLPASIEPARDLWPGVLAGIQQVPAAQHEQPEPGLVSSFRLLAVAASLTAVAFVLVFSRQPAVQTPATVSTAVPAPQASYMGPSFLQTRERLRSSLEERLAELSPQSRRMVESNLEQIERSLAAISEALEIEPGNVSLHHLMMETSRQQLELLQEFNRITGGLPEGVDI